MHLEHLAELCSVLSAYTRSGHNTAMSVSVVSGEDEVFILDQTVPDDVMLATLLSTADWSSPLISDVTVHIATDGCSPVSQVSQSALCRSKSCAPHRHVIAIQAQLVLEDTTLDSL